VILHGFLTDDLHEQRLIERMKKGDRDAFELHMDQYGKTLYRYIMSRVDNDADGKDILQETMFSIWRSITAYQSQSSFKTWAFSITRRRLADFYRKNSKNAPLPLTDYENTCEAKDDIEENTERMDIDRALSRLNEKESELVFLIFQAGLSYHEISTVLDIPVGTIKSRMSSIKAKLEKMLRGEE